MSCWTVKVPDTTVMADFVVEGVFLMAAIVTSGAMLCRCLYYRLLHPLHAFPGPLLASFTNLWEIGQIANGQLEYELLRLHQKYGKIVRIGPNHLSFSDEGAVKQRSRSIVPVKVLSLLPSPLSPVLDFCSSTFYEAFVAIRPSLFTVRDEEVHSAKRQRVVHGFSAQALAGMEQYIDNCVVKLIGRLDGAAQRGEHIDLKNWISFCVLNILGELAFSRSFGILDSGDESLLPPVQKQISKTILTPRLPGANVE